MLRINYKSVYFFLFLLSIPLFPKGTISGFVINKDSSAIHGAIVSIIRSPSKKSMAYKRMPTYKSGYYKFENIENGKYEIKITHSSYKTYTHNFSIKGKLLKKDIIEFDHFVLESKYKPPPPPKFKPRYQAKNKPETTVSRKPARPETTVSRKPARPEHSNNHWLAAILVLFIVILVIRKIKKGAKSSHTSFIQTKKKSPPTSGSIVKSKEKNYDKQAKATIDQEKNELSAILSSKIILSDSESVRFDDYLTKRIEPDNTSSKKQKSQVIKRKSVLPKTKKKSPNQTKIISFIDIGCGPFTSGLAFLEFLKGNAQTNNEEKNEYIILPKELGSALTDIVVKPILNKRKASNAWNKLVKDEIIKDGIFNFSPSTSRDHRLKVLEQGQGDFKGNSNGKTESGLSTSEMALLYSYYYFEMHFASSLKFFQNQSRLIWKEINSSTKTKLSQSIKYQYYGIDSASSMLQLGKRLLNKRNEFNDLSTYNNIQVSMDFTKIPNLIGKSTQNSVIIINCCYFFASSSIDIDKFTKVIKQLISNNENASILLFYQNAQTNSPQIMQNYIKFREATRNLIQNKESTGITDLTFSFEPTVKTWGSNLVTKTTRTEVLRYNYMRIN